mgnify:CR=1 FL=1
MTRTAPSKGSVGSGRKLSGSNEIKPFRDNETGDPYYDPKWDNPYQRESTPVNEDPKRKADRERQQRIDDKNWDSLTKQKKQEDFNLDLSGQVGFSHEIAEIGKDSISITVGVDFLPGPDVKIRDGKASVGVGVGLPLVGNVNGGLVIDLDSKQVTGISGGLEVLGLGIDFSTEKCHTTVTVSLGGIGITYGKDTCKEEEEARKKEEEETPKPPEPDPNEEPKIPEPLPSPGSSTSGSPPIIPNKGFGIYLFAWVAQSKEMYWNSLGEILLSSDGGITTLAYGYDQMGNVRINIGGIMDGYDKYRIPKRKVIFTTSIYSYPPEFESPYLGDPMGTIDEYPLAPLQKNGIAYGFREWNGVAFLNMQCRVAIFMGDSEEMQRKFADFIVPNASRTTRIPTGFGSSTFWTYYLGFLPYPRKKPKIRFPFPNLITPKKPDMCDLAPLMSLQRKSIDLQNKNNEMMNQSLELVKNSASAIGVGAFPAIYPGSLTTNKGTKQVNNLAEQVDTLYDTIDELMGKYPQKHKVKRKNKDGKDEEMDFEIPNQSEGQAELLGMMMQSLSQTSMSNNMENRQLQELALTRQMVVKLYYMVESIMEYLDYPTETTVVNLPMSITPLKRKGRNIEKLKDFGEMVKESIQPVIVTKKKSGDPETLKKYLLHLSHGAAIIKAAFWRKLSPENPKKKINANFANQEK